MGRASREKAARRESRRKTPDHAGRAPLWRSNAWKLGAVGFGVLLLGGLVALLALSSSQQEASGGGGTAAAGGGGGAKIGSINVAGIDGERISRPGGEPGVLFFMAGWCGTCIPEAEALVELKEQYGEDIEVLAVSIDPGDTLDNIRSFIATTGATSYPFHWDKDGQLAQRYEVRALDTTLVYDGRGGIVYRDAAPTDRDTLEAALKQAGLS